MKNLALAFCSIRPSQYPENVCDNREKEYLRSLKQLERVLPKSFDLLVCENTIDDESQIKDILKKLKRKKISDLQRYLLCIKKCRRDCFRSSREREFEHRYYTRRHSRNILNLRD